MNKYVNPPCNSLLVTSFIIQNIDYISPFGGSVASDERELANVEGVCASSAVPSSQFFPKIRVVVREEEKCVRRALEKVETSDGRAQEESEGDRFVDIMVHLEKETGGESEGLTFPDILQRADLLSETVLEGVVDTPDFPLR